MAVEFTHDGEKYKLTDFNGIAHLARWLFANPDDETLRIKLPDGQMVAGKVRYGEYLYVWATPDFPADRCHSIAQKAT